MQIEKGVHLFFPELAGTYLYLHNLTLKALYLGKGINLRKRISEEIRELETGTFHNKEFQQYYNDNKDQIRLIEYNHYKRILPKGNIKESKTKSRYNQLVERQESKGIADLQPTFNKMKTSEKFQMAL